jgi:hypothetical protein
MKEDSERLSPWNEFYRSWRAKQTESLYWHRICQKENSFIRRGKCVTLRKGDIVKRITALVLCLLLLPVLARADDAPAEPSPREVRKQQEIDAVKADITANIQSVAAIANQPVTHYARDPAIQVQIFSPGWFEGSAARPPDFKTADVRKTRQLIYQNYEYVSSDKNPQEMFKGADIEFNPAIKYFYTDLTVPKKRLSDAEMQEINRLYRVIAADQKKLVDLQSGKSFYALISRIAMIVAACVAVGLSSRKDIAKILAKKPGPVNKA